MFESGVLQYRGSVEMGMNRIRDENKRNMK